MSTELNSSKRAKISREDMHEIAVAVEIAAMIFAGIRRGSDEQDFDVVAYPREMFDFLRHADALHLAEKLRVADVAYILREFGNITRIVPQWDEATSGKRRDLAREAFDSV